MKSLFLKLFNLTAILTLLFCIALTILWPISYRISIDITRVSPDSNLDLFASRGEVGFRLSAYRFGQPCSAGLPVTWQWRHNEASTIDLLRTARKLVRNNKVDSAGFLFGRDADRSLTDTIIILPIWFLILIPLHLPAAAYAAHRGKIRRQRKLKKNLCPTCNYDLRATPTRCPECGTKFALEKV